jgi:hypothetical protein
MQFELENLQLIRKIVDFMIIYEKIVNKRANPNGLRYNLKLYYSLIYFKKSFK